MLAFKSKKKIVHRLVFLTLIISQSFTFFFAIKVPTSLNFITFDYFNYSKL